MKTVFLKHIRMDLRALAIFRICLGTLTIIDLLDRSLSFKDHYTDSGLQSFELTYKYFLNIYNFSLYFVSRSDAWAIFLFLLTITSAFFVIIGCKTRISTFITWILLVSLHNRNIMVLYGGDTLFRDLYFWSLFLPLNHRFSVDSFKSRAKPRKDNSYLSLASVSYYLQIGYIYFFAFMLKTGQEWWPDGTASYYALSLDMYSRSFGKFMVQFPEFLRISTYGVLFLEGAAIFLLFSPIYSNIVRSVTLIALAGMHLVFGLSLKLDFFHFFDFLSFIPLIPEKCVDKIFEFCKDKLAKVNLFTICSEHIRFYASQFTIYSEPKKIPAPLYETLLVAFFISLVTILNLGSIKPNLQTKLIFLDPLVAFLRIEQGWSMFAPNPAKGDGWFVAEGYLVDGTSVEVFSKKTGVVNFEKPANLDYLFKNHRWIKTYEGMSNVDAPENKARVISVAKHMCRSWNVNIEQSKQLSKFSIYFMLEMTQPPGQQSKIEKFQIANWECLPQKK